MEVETDWVENASMGDTGNSLYTSFTLSMKNHERGVDKSFVFSVVK